MDWWHQWSINQSCYQRPILKSFSSPFPKEDTVTCEGTYEFSPWSCISLKSCIRSKTSSSSSLGSVPLLKAELIAWAPIPTLSPWNVPKHGQASQVAAQLPNTYSEGSDTQGSASSSHLFCPCWHLPKLSIFLPLFIQMPSPLHESFILPSHCMFGLFVVVWEWRCQMPSSHLFTCASWSECVSAKSMERELPQVTPAMCSAVIASELMCSWAKREKYKRSIPGLLISLQPLQKKPMWTGCF